MTLPSCQGQRPDDLSLEKNLEEKFCIIVVTTWAGSRRALMPWSSALLFRVLRRPCLSSWLILRPLLILHPSLTTLVQCLLCRHSAPELAFGSLFSSIPLPSRQIDRPDLHRN